MNAQHGLVWPETVHWSEFSGTATRAAACAGAVVAADPVPEARRPYVPAIMITATTDFRIFRIAVPIFLFLSLTRTQADAAVALVSLIADAIVNAATASLGILLLCILLSRWLIR